MSAPTNARTQATLQVCGLRCAYPGRLVIDNLTLPPLPPGQFTALVGPNAAGKSTLLRAIAQLIPSCGIIRLGQTDIAALAMAERAALIGFMPQNLAPDTTLTVLESIIATINAASGRSGHVPVDQSSFTVLQRLGIDGLAMHRLDQLSGGQRQMASLAQAMALGPAVLLLDEPTSALDLGHSLHVMREIKRIARAGSIVIAILHDLALAAQWADHLIVLDNGAVDTLGTPEQAITAAMLARVYGVQGRVEHCSRGRLQIMVDQALATDI